MIECPNCKKQISEKALKCPHCQHELVAKKQYCTECGAKLDDNAAACSNCGHPVSYNFYDTDNVDDDYNDDYYSDDDYYDDIQKPYMQSVELTGVKNGEDSKNKLVSASITIIAIILAIVLGLFIFSSCKNKKYKDDLEDATSEILSCASHVEDCGNLLKKVWSNAIYEDRDDETDKYTRPDGHFVDFNSAINNLYNDGDFLNYIVIIKLGMSSIESDVKEMANPPKKYSNAYDCLIEYYNAFTSFADCVIDPTGSLTTFSATFSELDSEVASCYREMQLYIDGIIS